MADELQRLKVPSQIAELVHRAKSGERATEADLARALADPKWLSRLVANAVSAVRADPLRDLPFAPVDANSGRGLVLFDQDGASVLAFAAHRRSSEILSFTADKYVTAFHGASRIVVEIWRVPCDHAGDFAAVRAPVCRRAETRTISPGGWMALDRRTEAMRIVEGPAIVPLVRARWRQPSAVPARDYAIGAQPGIARLTKVAMSDQAASRALPLSCLLRHMARTDAGPAFAVAAASRDFTLRWHAMRDWLATDSAGAYSALVVMAGHDPHPKVRSAACAALSMVTEAKAA